MEGDASISENGLMEETTVSGNEEEPTSDSVDVPPTLSENDMEPVEVSGNNLTTIQQSVEQLPIPNYDDLLEMQAVAIELSQAKGEIYQAQELIEMAETMPAMFSVSYGKQWDSASNYYIYNQLDETGKSLWAAMEILYSSYLEDTIDFQDGLTDYVEVENVTGLSVAQFGELIGMFKYAHPQYYYLFNGFQYYYDSYNNSYFGVAFMTYPEMQDGQARRDASERIEDLILEWKEIVDACSSEEEKVRTIHNLICNKVNYNHDAVNAGIGKVEATQYTQSAYSVFCMDKTVCAGYTQAFSWMCNVAGISAFGVTSHDHAWNKVKVEDNWYNLDCTWDDGKGYYQYSNYLKNDNYFDTASSHIEESFWNGYLPNCTLDSGAEGQNYGELPQSSKSVATPKVTITKHEKEYEISISTETPGAKIFYTVDGKEPSDGESKSEIYQAPFRINETTTVKAVAVCNEYWDSEIAEAEIEHIYYSIASSTFGNHMTWEVDSQGVLTITGSGAMPDFVNSTAIPWNAYMEQIREVVLSESITTIGNRAFYGAVNLQWVEIPEGVTKIGNLAFQYSGINYVELPVSLTTIGQYAFSESALQEITIPASVTEVGQYAFYNCIELESVFIENNIDTMGAYIFFNCTKLTNVVLPDNLEKIAAGMFFYCTALKEIILPQNLKTIKEYAFEYCYGLQEITIPDSVTKISIQAFYKCKKLKRVKLGNGIKEIPKSMFYYCEVLESVTISESVTAIGELAFKGCWELYRIEIPATVNSFGGSVFELHTALIGYEGSAAQNYANSNGNEFINIETLGNKVEFVTGTGEKIANQYCKEGEKVKEPTSLTRKGYVFGGWYTSAMQQDETTKWDFSSIVTKPMTLYAKWIANSYTLSFDANYQGAEGIESQIVSYEGNYGSFPQIPERIGYTFQGWYTKAVGGVRVEEKDSYRVLGDSTLYAHWKANVYKITFHTDQTGLDIAEKEITYGEPFGTLPTLDLPGKIFLGWYTSQEGGSLVAEDGIYDVAGDTILYAHWKFKYTTEAPMVDIKSDSTVVKGTKVSFVTNTYGAKIFYTTQERIGTAITEKNGICYQEAIELTEDVTFYAIAVKEGYNNSEVVTFSYHVVDETQYQGEILDQDWQELQDTLQISTLDQVPKDFWIAGMKEQLYTGSAVTQENIRVYFYKTLLTLNKDYRIKYSNNVNAGTANITIHGRGACSGKYTDTFEIIPLNLQNAMLEYDNIELAYNEKVQKATVKVMYDFNGKRLTLKSGRDYAYVYAGTNPEEKDYDENAFRAEGVYEVIIQGKGNYTGSTSFTQAIVKKTMVKKLSLARIPAMEYTGEELKPPIELKDGSKILKEGVDYQLIYKNNLEIGTATVTIQGLGEYGGSRTTTFKINGRNLKKATLSGIETKVYQAEAVTQSGYCLTYEEEDGTLVALRENVDYTVSYRNHTKAGTATISFTGIHHYTGTIHKYFTIRACDLSSDNIQIEPIADQIYLKNGVTPKPVVFWLVKEDNQSGERRILLQEGVDYTISYRNHRMVGTADSLMAPTMILTGKGGFVGNRTITYTIQGAELSSVGMTAENVEFKNQPNGHKTVVKLWDLEGNTLVAGKDYHRNLTYTYGKDTVVTQNRKGNVVTVIRREKEIVDKEDIIPVGTELLVTATAIGGNYVGEKSVVYRVVDKETQRIKNGSVDIGSTERTKKWYRSTNLISEAKRMAKYGTDNVNTDRNAGAVGEHKLVTYREVYAK